MIRFPSDILSSLLSLRSSQGGEAGERSLRFLAQAGEEFEGVVLGRMGGVDLVSVGEYVVRVKGGAELPEGAWVRFRVVEPGFPARVQVIHQTDGENVPQGPTVPEAALRLKAGLFRLARDLAPFLADKTPEPSPIFRGSGPISALPAIIRGLALEGHPAPDHIKILASIFRAQGPDGRMAFKAIVEGLGSAAREVISDGRTPVEGLMDDLQHGVSRDAENRPASLSAGLRPSRAMPAQGFPSGVCDGPVPDTSASHPDPPGELITPTTTRDSGRLVQKPVVSGTWEMAGPFQGVKNPTGVKAGEGAPNEPLNLNGNPVTPPSPHSTSEAVAAESSQQKGIPVTLPEQKAAMEGCNAPKYPAVQDVQGEAETLHSGERRRMEPNPGNGQVVRDAVSLPSKGKGMSQGADPSSPDAMASVFRSIADYAEGLSRYQRLFDETSGVSVSFFPFWFIGGSGSGVSAWWKETESGVRKERGLEEVGNIVFDLVMDALGPVRLHLRGSGGKYTLSVMARAESLTVLRDGLPELKESADSEGFAISVIGLSPLTEQGPKACPGEGPAPGIFDAGFHLVT